MEIGVIETHLDRNAAMQNWPAKIAGPAISDTTLTAGVIVPLRGPGGAAPDEERGRERCVKSAPGQRE
jgi:hypothetical protein